MSPDREVGFIVINSALVLFGVWCLAQQAYTPGVLTAPLLLVLALFLASHLRTRARGHVPIN